MAENGKKIISRLSVLGGKPIIKGSRISVSLILNLIAHGMSVADVAKEYPRLTKEDVYAALEYAGKIVDNEKIGQLKIAK